MKKEAIEIEHKNFWILAMDKAMDSLKIMIHGTWHHFLMDENPLDANGCSKTISIRMVVLKRYKVRLVLK